MKPKFLRKKYVAPLGDEAELLREVILRRGFSVTRRPQPPKDTLLPHFRYGGREKNRHFGQKSRTACLKKPKHPEKVFELVLNHLKATRTPNITKEEVAQKLGLRTHFVEQAFQKLNHLGILTQEVRRHAHDTSREPTPWKRCSTTGWAANYYYVDLPKLATH